MTNIQILPRLTFDMVISNNEDWTDAWAYFDNASTPNPISLAGMTAVNFLMRPPLVVDSAGNTTNSSVVSVSASTGPTIDGIPVDGNILISTNVLALEIPLSVMLRIDAGNYLFEVQAVGDGITKTIARGNVTVSQGLIL